jgi:hypothetical protein
MRLGVSSHTANSETLGASSVPLPDPEQSFAKSTRAASRRVSRYYYGVIIQHNESQGRGRRGLRRRVRSVCTYIHT